MTKSILITWLTRPKFVDAPLTIILPRVYLQYTIHWYGIEYYSHCEDSISIVSVDILLDHYIVL